MSSPDEDTGDAPVTTHGPELAVAGLLALIGVLVVADSLRVGAGWGDDGPRAGYFPFYIGLALLGSSLWIGATTWLARRGAATGAAPASTRFATREELGRVLSVFWPMVVYVVAIKLLGIYVASAALIGWFMSRHGQHGSRHAEAHQGAHHRQQLGQQVPAHDVQRPEAQQPRGLHRRAGQHAAAHGAHDAEVLHPHRQRQAQVDQAVGAWRQGGHQQHQQQAGQGHRGIREHHAQALGPAGAPGGEYAQAATQRSGHRHREQGATQRDAQSHP